MFGFIEFKEEAHHDNLKLAHRIKEEVCELIDKLSKGGSAERRGMPYPFDERRGGGMSRRENYPQGGGYSMDERGGYGDRRYILDTEPSHPYHQSQPYPHHQKYDERYNY